MTGPQLPWWADTTQGSIVVSGGWCAPSTERCPNDCDDGVIWNDDHCGDPDHCDPWFPCSIHYKEDE